MNLEECRKKINLLDDQICDLFVERMKVSSEVAKAKMAAKRKANFEKKKALEKERQIEIQKEEFIRAIKETGMLPK